MIKKILFFLMMVTGIGALILGSNLPQRNPETLFLTQAGLKDYATFSKTFVEKKSLIIKASNAKENLFYSQVERLQEHCSDSCEIVTPRSMQKTNHSAGPELISLKTDQHLAILIMDDSDAGLKQLLTFAENDKFWGGSNISYAGMPYTNYLLDKYSLVIQEKLFPLMFVLGLIITLIFVNHIFHACAVYLPCLFSAGFSLTVLRLLHNEMNMVTSIIPLIVFTVGLGLSFHLYFSLKELGSLKEVFTFKWRPFFLMIFTTYIGFLSLAWSEIYVIREFGLISAHMVLICTIFTLIWYYLLESFLIFDKQPRIQILKAKFFTLSLSPKMIVLLSLLGVACVVLFAKQLPVVTDATEYFPKSEQIREKMLDVTETVSGIPLAEIHLSLKEDLNTEAALKFEQLEKDVLQAFQKSEIKIISNNQLVAMANGLYSGTKELPERFESYLLLRGQLPSGLQESYPVEKDYRLTILGQPMNSKEYRNYLETLKSVLSRHSMEYRINGLYYNLMLSQEAMIGVLTESFLSSALIIFIFSAFFLKTLKKTLIFVFVSLLPVALTFGGMKLFGFSINIATVMTFSISLGLVGDSSFHIIYAKDVRFKSFNEYAVAVLFPVVGSGLLLVVCFSMFTLNSFVPIRQFGGILAIVLLLGTLVDLYVLPTLLYHSTEHKNKYES